MLVLWLAAGPTLLQAQVPTPDEHLGRPLGADFALADWTEITTYFERLEAASPRVGLLWPGDTTEGRRFLVAVLGSEANLQRLPAIQASNRRLADPRGLDEAAVAALADEAVVTLVITANMHSTETASAQFAMEFAHRWATSQEEPWASARERVLVLLVPSLNPDGLEKVVSWYRQTVGTPHEASRLLELYHPYAGHDNNRDWFMVSQRETQIMTRLLYHEWFPHVLWDVHEQGQERERLFVPPFRDPLDPNLDPGVMTGLGVLGARMLHDLTSRGLSGVSTGVSYDMWWNGGNRNVPVRHNIAALLTEAASVDLASPVWLPLEDLLPPRGLPSYQPSNRFPAPWPGGWWRLSDIIRYELAAGESLLGSLAREPALWAGNVGRAALRAVAEGAAGSPRAWVIPSDGQDALAVKRLVELLLASGVELQRASGELGADGRAFPPGSLLVRRDQPYGRYVKDLFEVQRYPEGEAPYDVTAWSLPYLLGVHVVPVAEQWSGATEATTVAPAWPAATTPDRLTTAGWQLAIDGLLAGRSLGVPTAAGSRTSGTPQVPPGALVFDPPAGQVQCAALPRLAVYAPWSAEHDEGWTRFVLDGFGLPYRTVHNEDLRAGRLREVFDVLLLPSVPPAVLDAGRDAGRVSERHAGGLHPEGALAIEAFVREGGTLVAVEESARWVVDLLHLPLTEVASTGGFSCPGALLRTEPGGHALVAGVAHGLPVFFAGSCAFRPAPETPGLDVLLRYADNRLLLSGWVKAPEVVQGAAAWVRAEVGAGRVHLFGFRPCYRGWTQALYPLLFTALLLDGPQP